MSGKHSKNIFDIKNIQFKWPKNFLNIKTGVPLPFKITAILLVFSLVVSVAFIGGFFISGQKQRNILLESAKTFNNFGGNLAIESLSKQNEDIVGWINIQNTNICYAVCQSDNDSYYINHNQFGKKSRYGALFLSASDSFNRATDDRNIVIYGNNIKDGSMFGSLKKYRNINFYKQNPCIDIYYDKTQEKYIVFSVMLISSYKDDEGSIYKPYKSYFNNKTEFSDWLKETRARSIINTPVEVNFGDDMLTLVTSANDFDGARLVVVAKKVSDWDSEHTDVSNATIKSKTKYPKIWYTSRGLKYPY